MTAGRELPALRGLILLASPGRPLGDVLREQLTANPANAPVLDEAFDAIATLENGGRVDPNTRALGNARPDATLVTVPSMNHVLKAVTSDDRESNIAACTAPDLPLEPAVIDSIVAFVGKTHTDQR